jgi:hypothetical protein
MHVRSIERSKEFDPPLPPPSTSGSFDCIRLRLTPLRMTEWGWLHRPAGERSRAGG